MTARVCIDIEAAGSTTDAPVLEIGLALLRPDGRVEGPHSVLVLPPSWGALNTPAARYAAGIHKISRRELQTQGIPAQDAAQRVDVYLGRVAREYGDLQLWAHGASFESRLLGRAPWDLRDWACTLQLAQSLIESEGPRSGTHKLGSLCERFDIPLRNAHRAGPDAWATAHLLRHLLAMEEACAA
jgi:DNA polymerase III epsilon subunit-like protein